MTVKYLCQLVVDFTARSPEAALVLQVYWLWRLVGAFPQASLPLC